MIRRGRIGAAAAVLAVAALVTGCTGGGGGGEQQTTGTLNFYTNKGAWEPNFEALNALSEPDIEIGLDVTGYSDQPQYEAFIKQSFRTKESPGLFTWQTGPTLQELVEAGLIAETTDIWDEAIENGWVSEDLAQYYTFDGKQYCVPLNIAYWVMYYNIPIFEENGIEVPETWDDLMDAAATLKSNGVVPFYTTSVLFTFVWFETLVAGTDPELYKGLETGEVTYTDPRIVDIMNEWLEQEENGWFTDPGSTTDPAAMLNNGEMAMINFGTFFSGSLKGVGMEPGVDYGTFIIPAVNPDLDRTPVPVETGPLCTAESSPQRDMGLAYARWWMSPEAQSAWGEERGDVPFNPLATVSDQGLADLGAEIAGPDYELVTRYFEAAPAPILNVALEQLGAFIVNPGDPLPYLQTIQDAADQYWADQK
jgi:multiple sugar transport system substrate-binding protein